MPVPIPVNDWLQFIDDEYLSQFISDGGASIKFAAAPEASKAQLCSAMKARCEERGYLFVQMDAGTMRAYMPQDIFFALARQVDWRLLARRRVLSLAKAKGYAVDGIDPGTNNSIFEAIARRGNGLESVSVLREIRLEIQNHVSKSPNLVKDFRVAMHHLCLLEDARDGNEYTGEPILGWLTGVIMRIRRVHDFSIYTSINRTTARHFIESALHWVRQAEYAGTVVLFDNSRVTLPRNPRDGRRYYSRAMTMEHYELLREFIDGADRLAATLMVVMTNEEFLDGDSRSRGYGIYPALQTRVMNDVRDRNLANPAASLVQLS